MKHIQDTILLFLFKLTLEPYFRMTWVFRGVNRQRGSPGHGGQIYNKYLASAEKGMHTSKHSSHEERLDHGKKNVQS